LYVELWNAKIRKERALTEFQEISFAERSFLRRCYTDSLTYTKKKFSMATNVVMPKMGESITEGTVLRWLKKPGDTIQKDEPILEISTDKVDTEVPAPIAGTLLKQVAQEKETVAVGALIAVIGESGEKVESAPAKVVEDKKPEEAKPVAAEAPKEEPKQSSASQPGSGQAVVMPKMGESITEGTILRWLKKEGEEVKKDEPIVEISTDKVDTEVPSPFSGTLTKIAAQEKETIAVGATLAYIGGAAASQPKAEQPKASDVIKVNGVSAPAPQVLSVPAAQPVVGATTISKGSGNRFYSPLVRSIAKQEGISVTELDSISGHGLGGRVNKNDILSYLSTRGSAGSQIQSKPASQAKQAPSGPPVSFASDTVIPMDNIRMKTAEHMVMSKHTSAHVTSVSEVDMTAIVRFHQKHKEEFLNREGIKLTYTPLMIEAMVKAIKDFPFINASVEGTNIHVKKDINFGVAVGIPPAEGSPLPPALIVPVIKKAQDLNYAGIAKAVADLASRARNKKLKPDDISGGTFTITNPGMYGNLFGTPIINQPQVAIMTTGAIVKRVVVITDEDGNDTMAIRSMMYLGLSYDHRLIDGMYGVQFTERVKYYLENFTG
jgi:2-oxoglutarate dehydrogenase E2 component (dihydrolipoamide succinyltransferase)